MNNEQITEERFTYFWNLLLNNPNRFILINKRQNGGTHQECKKERNNLIERLETSFKLMNLPYERRLNKLRSIVVKPNPLISEAFGTINRFSFFDSAKGKTTTVTERTEGCLIFIDEMTSYDELNPGVILETRGSPSMEIPPLVTFGQAQHPAKDVGVGMGVFPSTGLPLQPISLRSPTTTDTFLPRVKLITSAIRDSAATPNILR